MVSIVETIRQAGAGKRLWGDIVGAVRQVPEDACVFWDKPIWKGTREFTRHTVAITINDSGDVVVYGEVVPKNIMNYARQPIEWYLEFRPNAGGICRPKTVVSGNRGVFGHRQACLERGEFPDAESAVRSILARLPRVDRST